MKIYKRIGKRAGGGIEKERTNGPLKQDLLVYDSRKTKIDVEELFNHVTQRGGKMRSVILNERYCECGVFEAYRYLCSYVITVCAHVHISPYQYVDNVCKIKNIIKAYSGNWNPLGSKETILEKSEPIIVLDESKIHDKGQPKSMRIRNKMDWIESQHTQTYS